MTSRIGNTDIDQVWDRFSALMVKAGRSEADDWELLDGDPEAQPRVPWTINDAGGRVILTLGYTKRDAFSALLMGSSVLAVAFGA